MSIRKEKREPEKMFLKNILKRTYRYINCKKGTYNNDLRLETAYLIGTEDFGNLGDHQIAISELEYLSRYFKNIVEVTATEYFKKRNELLDQITENNVIFLTGGGNTGNQYPYSTNIRRDVIINWPRNIKVVFPQTIFYTTDSLGKKELLKDKFFYDKSNKLIFVAREKESYDFLRKNFHCDSLLTPDIVLFSSKNLGSERENKVLTLLRSDVERKLTQKDEDEIKSILDNIFDKVISDDTQKSYDIPKENRDNELLSVFKSIASSKLVITDRLHGMVFSAISGTPCIVFQNYNHKVQGTYRWIKNLPYIHLVGDVNEMKKVLETRFYEESYYYDRTQLNELFDVIISAVRDKYLRRGMKTNK